METALVEMLTQRVRVLSTAQIASEFFRGQLDPVEILLEELERAGLVERRSVLARPILSLDAPVISWRPGAETPDYGKAAYRLKTRWSEPARPTQIVQASGAAVKQFGGYLGGRWPRTSEITHDLNLAKVFLWHCRHRPDDAAAWIPEAQLYAEGRGHRERLPDAVVRSDGVDVRVVEFGGSYGKQKLQSFHAQLCELPYEVW